MAQSIRIWKKKQLRLDKLNFKQREMVQIGSTGLISLFKRVASSQGPNDGAAKPLTKKYAIYKSRRRLGNRRNLFLTGQMLRSLKLRTVSDNRAYASVGADMRAENRELRKKDKSVRKLTNKDVAWVNQKREPWMVWSPANRRVMIEKFKEIFAARTKRLVISKKTGIDLG
jgi:hypothetical protein